VLHPSFRPAASPWPLVYSSPDATILDNEREIRFVIPKNRGPDQCAPVIRAAIMVREADELVVLETLRTSQQILMSLTLLTIFSEVSLAHRLADGERS
jgi:hypothetical protein